MKIESTMVDSQEYFAETLRKNNKIQIEHLLKSKDLIKIGRSEKNDVIIHSNYITLSNAMGCIFVSVKTSTD